MRLLGSSRVAFIIVACITPVADQTPLRPAPQRQLRALMKIDDEQLLPSYRASAVFRPWDRGIPCWRIPVAVHIPMAVGVPDTLILFAEGRWTWGDGCNAPGFGPCRGSCKEPTEPVAESCQAVLDAVCNAPENIDCLFDSHEWSHEHGCADQPALPLVGLFDGAIGRSKKTWRCYGRNGLDSTHQHWNETCTGYCSEDEALLSNAYSTAPACGGAGPWPPPSEHPPSPPGAKRAIFSRTSTDNGISWTNIQLVAGNATKAGERGDPGPVWHAASKTLLLHVGGAGDAGEAGSDETWQLTSTDLGVSWSSPISISSELGAAAGFRPIGGGLALSSGRLMMAGYGELGQPWPHSMGIDGVVAVWYSDDIGASWQLADVACSSTQLCNSSVRVFTGHVTESVLAELPGPKGGVILSSRVDGAHLRRTAICNSPSSGRPLFDARKAPKGSFLPDATGCAGGLVKSTGSLFYSNAIANDRSRRNMTVLRSDDRGRTWTHGAIIDQGLAAYSTLCTTRNASEVGIAYERPWNNNTNAWSDSPCFPSIWWQAVPAVLPKFSPPPLNQHSKLLRRVVSRPTN